MLLYSLEAALEAKGIDEVYVSSDSPEILEVARSIRSPKLKLLPRSAELATDTASTEAVMLDFARHSDFDRLVLIQATSPLTTSADLDGALLELGQKQADSLVSVTREHRFLWRMDEGAAVPLNYRPEARPRRQDWDGELFENGAFYVSSRELLLKTGCRLHGKVTCYVMDPKTRVELDTPEDWDLVSALLRGSSMNGGTVPSNIELIVSDVDGVLTDGGMYYGPLGESSKKFNTKDGMGIRLWREAGFRFAVITGEDSPSVRERMKKLQISEYHAGIQDKLAVLSALVAREGISLERTAFIGDDVNDLAAMRAVGLAACPADAHPLIRELSDYVCAVAGGSGCVRELIDRLLSLKGRSGEAPRSR